MRASAVGVGAGAAAVDGAFDGLELGEEEAGGGGAQAATAASMARPKRRRCGACFMVGHTDAGAAASVATPARQADAIEGRAVERVQDVLGPEPARRRILRRRRSLQGNAEDPIDVEVGRDKLLDELDLLDVRGVRLHQEIVDL